MGGRFKDLATNIQRSIENNKVGVRENLPIHRKEKRLFPTSTLIEISPPSFPVKGGKAGVKVINNLRHSVEDMSLNTLDLLQFNNQRKLNDLATHAESML